MQQHARLAPVALDGALRHAAKLGDLVERKAAEEMKIHQLDELVIDLFQLLERLPKLWQILGQGRGCCIIRQRDLELPAPAALRASLACVVDHQSTHGARRIREKPVSLREFDAFAIRDIQVSLVQQRRRAEAEPAATAPEMMFGQPVQLMVQRREQFLDGRRIGTVGTLDQRFEIFRHALSQGERLQYAASGSGSLPG